MTTSHPLAEPYLKLSLHTALIGRCLLNTSHLHKPRPRKLGLFHADQ